MDWSDILATIRSELEELSDEEIVDALEEITCELEILTAEARDAVKRKALAERDAEDE